MNRSCYCAEVGTAHRGQKLTLLGWVHSRRDHGGVLFIDLRDRTGIVQIVFNPDPPALFSQGDQLRSEFVIQVSGVVRDRPEGTVNPNIPTGQVEMVVDTLQVLNRAKTPPFEISEHSQASEEVRLKYRYLDLRRPQLLDNMRKRHRITQLTRDVLIKEGFYDIETPMLTRSTPEGARDFLVPSRLSAGQFYALPQSPQLFKQLLMIGGMDRYFQIARCFRDEDLRADRQPEFTQIDLEMSFSEESDVMDVVEKLMAAVLEEGAGLKVKRPFPRMSYEEARSHYGIDRPDLRIPEKIVDLTPVFPKTKFERFKLNLEKGGVVKGLRHQGGAAFTRKEVDDLTKFAQGVGAKGLAWLKWDAKGQVESPIAKFLSVEEMAGVNERAGAKPGDIVFFVSDTRKLSENVLGALRLHLWSTFIVKGRPPALKEAAHLLWIKDFPLFEWSDEEKRWVSVHHPFTSPRPEDIEALNQLDPVIEVFNPKSVLGNFKARAYDLVLNGTELGGGSIRVHKADVQRKILSLLGLKPHEYAEKFGFLIEALDSGAPPHGGIALGLDRLIAILVGEDSIRDVIAFPKTQKGTCPLTKAPGRPDEKQLRDLSLKTAKKIPSPVPGK